MTTGTYENSNPDYYVIADYFQNVGEPNERDYTIDHDPAQPNCYFKIVITTITDNLISGTFTGNYLFDTNYDESITITEGAFTVKRHH